ncbi:MAG TPA: DUF881 domain-containing protein [Mycobacteriales bacterium]|nr:DUF881 domain-containing protein [Mycobacteriales bacterium]
MHPDPSGAPRRVDGSMSLLVDMSAAALDPSYADAAARRGDAGERVRLRLSGRVLAGLLVVGLGTGVAAAQTRERADEISASRRALLADVLEQTAATDRLAGEASRLRTSVSRTRSLLLGADERGRQAAALVAALELASGAVPVHGPGILVTLDDAPSAGQGAQGRGGQAGDGRVLDRDVQDVVNALWAAGAEAVSVNNQRLTVQTAIRAAGEAVLVDLRPLSPPYLLRAVGDVDALEPAFVDSATARRFHSWTSLYGLGFQVRRADDLRLPAAGQPALRLARPGGPS